MMTETTETRVTIKRLEGPADTLLHIYDGQNGPQDCYISLDLRDGEMRADYNAEIGNAVPSDVWHGIVRRYPIPVLQPATVNALMDEIAPLAQRVVDGTEIVWGGSNHVARLNLNAQIAEGGICGDLVVDRYDRVLREEGNGIIYPEMESDVYWWDAADWFDGAGERDVVREDLALQSIDQAHEDLQGDGSREETPVLIGLRQYLETVAAETQD